MSAEYRAAKDSPMGTVPVIRVSTQTYNEIARALDAVRMPGCNFVEGGVQIPEMEIQCKMNLKLEVPPFENTKEARGWRQRVRLYGRALLGQVEGVTLFTKGVTLAKGWQDIKTKITYVTWRKK